MDLLVRFERQMDGQTFSAETVNVEMQSSMHGHFADRTLAYSSRLISYQLDAGGSYGDLRTVYSLVFSAENLAQFKDVPANQYLHHCRLLRKHPSSRIAF